MPILHMETELVRSVGNQMQQASASMQQQTQQLNNSVQNLANAWQGPSASIFMGEIQPMMQRLNQFANTGELLNQRLQREVDEWERVGSQLGGTSGNSPTPTANSLQDRIYENGQDSFVKGDAYFVNNYDPLNFPDQLYQDGPNCTLYGLFHLLHMSGITLSQQEINQLIAKYRKGIPSSKGIPFSAVKDILKDKGIQYDVEEFGFWGKIESTYWEGRDGKGVSFDTDAMENHLIDQVKQGKPVYVVTDSEMFGYDDGQGGHAFTVIGVNVDKNGDLISVLVDTNWDPPNTVKTIEGDQFVKDWFQRDCHSLVIL